MGVAPTIDLYLLSCTCMCIMGVLAAVVDMITYGSVGVIFGVPMAVTFYENVGGPAKVSGPSMRKEKYLNEPSLNPSRSSNHHFFQLFQDDIVWVSRNHLQMKKRVKPGVVVAVRSPVDPSDQMVKRVIAVDRDILTTKGYKQQQVLIPDGHVWIEGDNIKRSRDSNLFGPISEGLVVGIITHILWPPHRMGKMKHCLSAEHRKRLFSKDINGDN